ncbi:FMN-binding glutamate synthase family protein [Psychromonas marina]|uniref:FMN-binding glutamate synthase family protein n=1 Tax=Psychromonas marina TaxID=88364 RepID=A0ABQ6E147_9GAMM|nr:FMN-binding glutamate synthase family protein [Psychromonas marina]GLS91113.1 FMN-binding glutamate synthase family protein [Psychromonas marina]
MTMREAFVKFSIGSVILIAALSLLYQQWLWVYVVLIPVILVGFYDMVQHKQSIRRLYPVFGRFRYLLESIRPEIQQYFVENETSGTPIPREFRSLVYQRSKGDRDTRPFGTIFDVNRDGYEWVNHSMQPKHLSDFNPRVKFGGPDCLQPYMSSPLNISAMSYGALSKNAIMALNRGAKIGGFSHNTGEGSISPYHLKHGGDIVWQLGTGYFGCRNDDGRFNSETFAENAQKEVVKMIEIKLSQGAKPGHGGILPAVKLTEEIAAIRHVPMGQDVVSPPSHSAFSTPIELLHFIKKLRDLSGGKPIGFKLCVGRHDEFIAICKAMKETGILPDFITVDGGEGGTGAAPTEMTNSVGTPIRDGLIFVNNALIGFGLRKQIRIIASGKMFSAFHILRAIALGADTVNSARGMMMSLGCIQARTCNTDQCPTGIATQNPSRNKAIVVTDKALRVANFQRETVRNLVELVGAAGLNGIDELKPKHINRRVQGTDVQHYAQLYPTIEENALLDEAQIPESWRDDMREANAASW